MQYKLIYYELSPPFATVKYLILSEVPHTISSASPVALSVTLTSNPVSR